MKEDKKCLKAIVDIGEHEDRVITIIKGKFG